MTHFIGCIQVRPALNDAERGHLLDLLDSDGTLRGTPTGRGDTDVPFARLAWEVCPGGCCLEWGADDEDAKWMADSLRFLVDHLLRPGAKAEGRARFGDFTFDHVLSGTVMGRGVGDRATYVVPVADNVVTGRSVPAPCDALPTRPLAQHATRPANVIELRPRPA